MYSNYHTHTTRCKHAVGSEREYVEAAIASGLRILGFSDHCPWIFDDGFESGTRMVPSQMDDYCKCIEGLKKEYKNDIKIYLGLECEYIPELMDKQNEFLKDYPLDYRIMGEHFIHREPFSTYCGFETTDEQFLSDYADTVIEGMETGMYAYLAHPDLLNYVGPDDIYNKHMGRLCKYLLEHDIPVEINRLGVFQGRHYPSDKFLRLSAGIGNKAIVGIDAHEPEAISDTTTLKRCEKIALDYGFELIDVLPGLDA